MEQSERDLEGVTPKIQKRLLTPFISKKVSPFLTEEERKPFPESKANIISRIFFWWVTPILKIGYRRTLDPSDLFYLTDEGKVDFMSERFYIYYSRRIAKDQKNFLTKKYKESNKQIDVDEFVDRSSADEIMDELEGYEPSQFNLIFSLIQTFKAQLFSACVFMGLSSACQTCNPLLSRKLISFVELRTMGLASTVNKGVGYAIGTTLLTFIAGILMNHAFYNAMRLGIQMKTVLIKVMLQKSFKLDGKSQQTYTVGKITSLMGTDLSRIEFGMIFQPLLITLPIPVIISIAILIHNIGVSALVGIGLLFIFIFFMFSIVKLFFKYRIMANTFTDARVDYIKEVLINLKIIKFYSWENPYHQKISDVRCKEMQTLYKMYVLRNIIGALAMSMTLLTSMVSFLVLYAVRSNGGDPAKIFSSVSLFGTLSQQINMIPIALATGTDAFLALRRLNQFLAAKDIDPNDVSVEPTAEARKIMDAKDIAIKVDHASFKWEDPSNEETAEKTDGSKPSKSKKKKNKVVSEVTEKESTDSNNTKKGFQEKNSKGDPKTEKSMFPGLNDLTFEVKKNEFVVVTGSIGSGKTSLLNAISGFMTRTSGTVAVDGSELFCGQPWVQNTSVKENILFGSEYDEKRYSEAVYACSLESDLELLPAGDNTEIGERGITLSGGQKARINLARAVYANRDIILLDDVLSAVDARVGRHIMNNCILGLLKEKTRVLSTHQLSLIGSANRIIFMNGDGSIEMGLLEELRLKNTAFRQLMEYSTETLQEDEEENTEVAIKEKFEHEEDLEAEKELLDREVALIGSELVEDDEAIHRAFNEGKSTTHRLIDDEVRAVNSLKFLVYHDFIKEGSGSFPRYSAFIMLVFLAVISTFCMLFTNTWLSFWIQNKFLGRSAGFYIGIYVMFTILSMILLTFECIVLAYICNRASKSLLIKITARILHAPMSFMDTTPMGRILNRFTKDTDVLDSQIEEQLRTFIISFSQIIGVLILCIIYIPWFAIAVPFMFAAVIFVGNYYQASAREIKRIESTQRSYVYDIFNESLGGMVTIKAYNEEGRFIKKVSHFLDKTNEAYYLTIASQRWVGINLDVISSLFVLLIALLCVNRVFKVDAASVGLLLSYSFQITGLLTMMIRTYTQVENEMNSVERIVDYATNLPEEAAYYADEFKPPPDWPPSGGVQFENASMAYRPGLPLVLKELTFDVKPHEKIGVCGRTGAGKSSIMTALYRLTELHSGKILIDGIDISTLGLNDLRSRLAIIPQDPVLFKGNVRKNLDPFGDHNDQVLWDALRRSGLLEPSKLETIKNQKKDDPNLYKFHLDQNIEDEGGNFSLGEKQLLAFARAVVRDAKILILDEATSSVDYETDAKIQANIVNEFSDSTILCIAHRLRTIINYDKILVLDKGMVKEYDSPWKLFNIEGSIFRQMCERSDITASDFKESKQESS